MEVLPYTTADDSTTCILSTPTLHLPILLSLLTAFNYNAQFDHKES